MMKIVPTIKILFRETRKEMVMMKKLTVCHRLMFMPILYPILKALINGDKEKLNNRMKPDKKIFSEDQTMMVDLKRKITRIQMHKLRMVTIEECNGIKIEDEVTEIGTLTLYLCY